MEAIRDLSPLSGFSLGLDLTSGELVLGDGVTSAPYWRTQLRREVQASYPISTGQSVVRAILGLLGPPTKFTTLSLDEGDV